MGYWLKEQQLIPDLIICSPAKRAFGTAKRICQTLDLPLALVRQDDRLYNSTVTLLLQVVQECSPDVQNLMLVGHNPAFEEFLQYMLKNPLEEPDTGTLLPKAALAHLQLVGPWAKTVAHSADLVGLTHLKIKSNE